MVWVFLRSLNNFLFCRRIPTGLGSGVWSLSKQSITYYVGLLRQLVNNCLLTVQHCAHTHQIQCICACRPHCLDWHFAFRRIVRGIVQRRGEVGHESHGVLSSWCSFADRHAAVSFLDAAQRESTSRATPSLTYRISTAALPPPYGELATPKLTCDSYRSQWQMNPRGSS
jgi:hypothetical protein